MKKTLKLIGMLALTCALAFSFVSCGEKKGPSGDYLPDLLDKEGVDTVITGSWKLKVEDSSIVIKNTVEYDDSLPEEEKVMFKAMKDAAAEESKTWTADELKVAYPEYSEAVARVAFKALAETVKAIKNPANTDDVTEETDPDWEDTDGSVDLDADLRINGDRNEITYTSSSSTSMSGKHKATGGKVSVEDSSETTLVWVKVQ